MREGGWGQNTKNSTSQKTVIEREKENPQHGQAIHERAEAKQREGKMPSLATHICPQ